MSENKKKNEQNEENERNEETSSRPLRRHVSLHRSYGVTRKEGIGDKILHGFYMTFFTFILLTFACVIFVILFNLLLYAPAAMRFLAAVLLLVLALFVPGRLFFKRLSFVRKLRRFAKKNHYRLTFKRHFFASFFHSAKSPDFILSTGRHRYCVCYLTVLRRQCYVTFTAKDKIMLTTNIGNNRFAEVYGLLNHTREKDFVFPAVAEAHTPPIRVILCNPAPNTIFRIQPDGVRVTSGTGDVAFGCHIHTGSGFLHAVDRRERE